MAFLSLTHLLTLFLLWHIILNQLDLEQNLHKKRDISFEYFLKTKDCTFS